jgi:hypothetical protein
MNMNHALKQGKDAFNLMQTAPSPLGLIQEANEISIAVIDNAKSIAGIWDSFIGQLKIFTDIMDKISGVNNYTRPPFVLNDGECSSYIYRSIRMQIWRGAFCPLSLR